MRAGEEPIERGSPARVAQIDVRAALADGHLRQERADLLEARRIDAQDLRPVGGEQPRAHRSGHDAREVEDADAGEGRAATSPRVPGSLAGQRSRGAGRRFGRSRRHGEEGLAAHRDALRVGGPLGRSAQARRAAALGDHGRLEVLGAPGTHRARNRLARLGGPEDAQDRVAMMPVVRVQPDEAVLRAVVAGDRVPDGRQGPPLGLEEPLALEPGRRVAAIHVGRGVRAGARGVHGGDGRGRGGDRGGGERADRVRGRQAGRPRDLDARRRQARRARAALLEALLDRPVGARGIERGPDVFEQGDVAGVHAPESGRLSRIVNVDYSPR